MVLLSLTVAVSFSRIFYAGKDLADGRNMDLKKPKDVILKKT